MKTKIHLGMPPMKTVRGEQFACFQLISGRRAIGAVLFVAWSPEDIRVHSLRFDDIVSAEQQKAFIAEAQQRLAILIA